MDFLLNVSSVLDRIARSIGKWIGWIMLPLIMVIMFDVLTRKLDVTRLIFFRNSRPNTAFRYRPSCRTWSGISTAPY